MTDDDLDALKNALKAATPAASPTHRDTTLRLALHNFDRLQASADAARPTESPPQRAGLIRGVFQMLNKMTSRQTLAGTASVAAVCLGVVALWPTLTRGPVMPQEAKVAPQTEMQSSAAMAEEAPAEVVADAAPEPALAGGAPEADAPVVMQEAAPTVMASEPEPEVADAIVADQAAPATAMVAPVAPAPLARSEPAVGLNSAAAGNFGSVAPEASLRTRSIAADGVIDEGERAAPPVANTESFATAAANPVKITAEEPVSTFSIDVDTASYAVVRQSIDAGQLPPAQAVRVEEMVNYFPYSYPAPATDGAPFQPTVTVMPTPWAGACGLAGRNACHRKPPALEPCVPDRHFGVDG